MIVRPALAALALLAVSVSVLAAQPACRSCGTTGEKECKRHRGVLELERATHQCSVAAACQACGGALATDCVRCKRPELEAQRQARRAAAQAWLVERRAAVDAFANSGGILHGQSEHVDLAFSIEPQTVGRTRLDSHRLMHLYLERIEAVRAEFLATFGLSEADFAARLQLYLFADRDDHRAMAPRVAGGGAEAVGMKLMGEHAVYCMWHDKRVMPADEEIHRTVVHNTAHLLLGNARPEQWIGNRTHGWVDEGVAHWFEERLTGKCLTYCFEEVGVVPGAFKGGRWKVALRKLVEEGKLVPFPVVARLNVDQLDPQQRAQAFAYVDFLLATRGGPKFMAFVRRIKQKQPLRDALPAELGLTVLALDPAFKAWVRETYPLREPR